MVTTERKAFVAAARAAGVLVESMPARADAVASISRLAEPERIAAGATAAELVPPGAMVEAASHDIAAAEVGVSLGHLGVAETGGVMLLGTTPAARLSAVLPAVHVVVLDAARIVPGLEDALSEVARLRDAGVPYVTMITGPSRTADIERVITVGAHGPRELRILLVGG